MSRWTSSALKDLLSKATPDRQAYFAHNLKATYLGDYPAMGYIAKTAGTQCVVQWLMAALTNLSMFSGAKNLDVGQLRETAIILIAEYPYLRITEFMLFFHRFKAGRYGKFYGNVDPLTITSSIRDFIQERGAEIAHIEQEERERRRQEELDTNPPITWEEHCRRHGKTYTNPLNNYTQ